MEFFGDGGAAHHCTPLEHGDLEPGGGQIGRTHQAVVTAADNDHIALLRMNQP